MPIFIEKAKISEMKKFLLSHGLVMQQDTLFRVLRGEIDLAESVKNCIDHARREDFLSCLSQDQDLDLIVEKGLSKELLEWLLVSQGILHPQVEHGLEIIESPIDPVLSKQYINVVYEGFYNNPKTSEAAKRSLSLETLYGLLGKRNKELLQELSTYASATSKERYSNNIGSKKENILIWIFHQSFQHNPDNVITAAEIANGGKTVYPHWKKVCLIQLPKIPATLLANPIFQVAFIVSTLAISILSVYRAHEAIKHLLVTKGVPFIINHVPLQIIQAANGMLKTKDFLWKNSLKIILVSWLLKQSVARLPNIPYLSAAIRTINVWAIINVLLHSPQSLLSFAVTTSFNVLLGVWDLSKEASYQFHRISSNADKERLALCRKEALGLWKSCVTR